MSLTCDRLMKFDLIESLESNMDMLIEFLTVSFEIKTLDDFIRDLPSYPRSTDKIIRNELARVIGNTLAIEGTLLEKEEIEESLNKADQGKPLMKKEQEAANSKNVYDFIFGLVDRRKTGLEYNEQIIQQIHTLFTRDIPYVSNAPGLYRSFPVTFGDPRRDCLCQTLSDIQSTMQGFIKWLNTKGNSPISQDAFARAIMSHYYLTEIHPFGDGNGRTARALEALVLYAHGVNEYCFWSLANFWSSHKDEYMHHLGDIRRTLNPIPFVLWGLQGYRDELKQIKEKVRRKVTELMFGDYIQFLLRNRSTEFAKLNPRLVIILELLIARGKMPLSKFLRKPEVQSLYFKLVASTKTRDFQKLAKYELVKYEEEGGKLFIEPNYGLLNHLTYKV